MELAIIVVAAAVIIAAVIYRSRSWQTVATGNGRTAEEVQAKYAYLKANQVKCKLKTEEAPTMGAVQGSGNYADGPTSNVRLEVHKKDVDRATELLKTFGEQDAAFSL
ncbi:hypothetical protein [Paenibacillus sp. HJGM_3]|uniref:hypothetical protein n=1 Tax=Paenibacillus sp. HJGM_3 TaxID=3379816 RepID=UPI003859D10F